jgi:hypothetical protein
VPTIAQVVVERNVDVPTIEQNVDMPTIAQVVVERNVDAPTIALLAEAVSDTKQISCFT